MSVSGLEIVGIRTPGLGDSTYLVTFDGLGVLVDPQRDVDRFLSEFERSGVDVRWVLETHIHNDYVSGGREAARRTGAELVIPASAAAAFGHTPAFHLEDLSAGRLTVRPLHTPGHTPEHTSYLLLIDGLPQAVFSGGSLLVGSAGRPDLLGPERADTLARLQYRSVHRLAELPDPVGLYPTHGEGSFCTATGAGLHTSTIGAERRTNPVLSHPNEDRFVTAQMAGLQPWPTYYRHMGPANLYGYAELPRDRVGELSEADVALLETEGVRVVDARPRERFAASHLPGSLGVELRDDFGTWVGWLLDIDTPVALVLDPDQDLDEALLQLYRIGLDDVRGVMRGIDGWMESGRPVAGFRTVGLAAFAEAAGRGVTVVDVRSPGEWAEGHLDGSIHAYLPDLAEASNRLDTEEVWIACGSGYRAVIAAGILERRGYRPVALSQGGVPDLCRTAPVGEWTAPCDPPLQRAANA